MGIEFYVLISTQVLGAIGMYINTKIQLASMKKDVEVLQDKIKDFSDSKYEEHITKLESKIDFLEEIVKEMKIDLKTLISR